MPCENCNQNWNCNSDEETDGESDDESCTEKDNNHNNIPHNNSYHNINIADAEMSDMNPDTKGKSVTFYECSFVSHNVLGLKNDDKLEGIVEPMIVHSIDLFLAQETWLACTRTINLRGFATSYHGLSKAKSDRGERGVAIILSPRLSEFYENASVLPPPIKLHLRMVRTLVAEDAQKLL